MNILISFVKQLVGSYIPLLLRPKAVSVRKIKRSELRELKSTIRHILRLYEANEHELMMEELRVLRKLVLDDLDIPEKCCSPLFWDFLTDENMWGYIDSYQERELKIERQVQQLSNKLIFANLSEISLNNEVINEQCIA